MILICLPYAGGSSVNYLPWQSKINLKIKLHPVELKGRGRRLNEGLPSSIDEVVEDIFNKEFLNLINKEEYALFGHSMGGVIAYELYLKTLKLGKRLPKHIFFSGCEAPYTRSTNDISHNLPDEEFINKIVNLGGTPREVVEDINFKRYFLPIIKNDFKILENYKTVFKGELLCDFSILYGNKDYTITVEGLKSWGDIQRIN